MGKSIKELEYSMQSRAQAAWDRMNNDKRLQEMGVASVAISETGRSLAVQMAYYSRSRMLPADVRRMYAAAGLYDPTDEECRTACTWTLDSKHIQGKAIDFVPVNTVGKYWWNAPEEVWERMGEIGEENGLKWGGRWKNKDCPHFEV